VITDSGLPQPVHIRDLVMRFYHVLWNEWDDDAIDTTLAPEVTFRGSLGQHTIGRDGWRRYRDQIQRSAPDFHNDVVELLTDGRRAAARLKFTGTHLGPLLGIPPTGRAFTYTGAAFFTAAVDLITDIWVIGDLDELRRQLVNQ
jgi:steroid delta-isomerase-like uncharacterized protein